MASPERGAVGDTGGAVGVGVSQPISIAPQRPASASFTPRGSPVTTEFYRGRAGAGVRTPDADDYVLPHQVLSH